MVVEKSINPEENTIISGVIWKQILFFFFPILFGTFFQQLYNTVDTLIVSRMLGKQALAAVGGGTSSATSLLIGFFTGLSSGATVIISQFYGIGDKVKTNKAVHNAAAMALWGGIAISVCGYAFSETILKLVNTPEDVMPLALTYMHIYFGGGIFTVMYNMASGILRAFGDSKNPLYSVIIGCIANIILDFIFVGPLKLGVAGAAYATVLSQAASLVFLIINMLKDNRYCKLKVNQIHFEPLMLKRTLSIGMPAGIQSVLYAVSNLVILTGINFFGTNATAAWSAYGRLDCIYWMMINAFGISITTFVGQNYGAQKYDRVKKGVKSCLLMSLVATAILEVFYLCACSLCLAIFSSDTGVIETGTTIIKSIAPFFFFYIPVEVLSGALRGEGKTFVPSMFTLFGICVFRAVWIAVLPRINNTLECVCLCYPASWFITALMFIIYYYKTNSELGLS